jgi:uncharacterized paraquat-inducible protein A
MTMTATKQLRGECLHCGELFEFPVEAIGTTGECPRCGKQTEFILAAPPQESEAHASRKMVIWTVVAISILIGCLLASIYAVHLARQLMEEHRQPSPPPSTPSGLK